MPRPPNETELSQPKSRAGQPPPMPRWAKRFLIGIGIAVLLFAVLHVFGRGLGGH